MPAVLIHIGYHKTGTNWLQRELFDKAATGYRWLGKRPETHPVWGLVADHALEFDAAKVRGDLESRLQKAEKRGLLPVVSLERLSGHPFSGGHDSSQIAERLKQVFPDSRVLAVIREQRTMIVSTYKQYVKAGGACSLPEFLDPPTRHNWRVPWFHLRHFEYDHLIRKYHALWGAENVLFLPYEQFVRDGRGFVERVAEFAGRTIPEDVLERLPYSKRSNQSPSALTIAALRRLNKFTPRTELNPAPLVQSRLTARFADRLKESDLLAAGRPRDLVTRSEAHLKQVVEETVGERYAASNARTAELAGLDLAAYGWPVS
jgi:sulfotransferase family protein